MSSAARAALTIPVALTVSPAVAQDADLQAKIDDFLNHYEDAWV